MNRRGFLKGLGFALAAPAIVHAGNLMPIKTWTPPVYYMNGYSGMARNTGLSPDQAFRTMRQVIAACANTGDATIMVANPLIESLPNGEIKFTWNKLPAYHVQSLIRTTV